MLILEVLLYWVVCVGIWCVYQTLLENIDELMKQNFFFFLHKIQSSKIHYAFKSQMFPPKHQIQYVFFLCFPSIGTTLHMPLICPLHPGYCDIALYGPLYVTTAHIYDDPTHAADGSPLSQQFRNSKRTLHGMKMSWDIMLIENKVLKGAWLNCKIFAHEHAQWFFFLSFIEAVHGC